MRSPLDFFYAAMDTYGPNTKVINMMKQRWGTTTVDGISVFKEKHKVYPIEDMSYNIKYFLTQLGMYEDMVEGFDDLKGIKKVYMYLNKGKMEASSSTFYADTVANRLDVLFPLNEEYTVTLKASETSEHVLSTNEVTADYVYNNWETLLRAGKLQSVDTNDVTSNAGRFMKFAIMDIYNTEKDFEITVEPDDFEIQLYTTGGKTVDYSLFRSTTPIVYHRSVNFTAKVKRISQINTDSKVVDVIMTAYTHTEVTKKEQNGDSMDDVTYDVPVYFAERSELYDNIFYTPVVSGGIFSFASKQSESYLRTDVLEDKDVRAFRFSAYIGAALDFDYVKEKVSGWKKFISVAIVFVVVVVSIMFPPAAIAAQGALAVIGFALTAGSLMSVAMSMYFAKNGEYNLSQMQAKTGASLGKMASYVGIANIISNGITNMTTSRVANMAVTFVKYASDVMNKNKLNDAMARQNSALNEKEEAQAELVEMTAGDLDITQALMKAETNPLQEQENIFNKLDYQFGPPAGVRTNEFGSVVGMSGGVSSFKIFPHTTNT